MSYIPENTPCSYEPFICPYNAETSGDCYWYCAEDDDDYPEIEEYNENCGDCDTCPYDIKTCKDIKELEDYIPDGSGD